MDILQVMLLLIIGLAAGFVCGSIYMIRIRSRRVEPVYCALQTLRRQLDELDQHPIHHGINAVTADAYNQLELYVLKDYWECCPEAAMRRTVEVEMGRGA